MMTTYTINGKFFMRWLYWLADFPYWYWPRTIYKQSLHEHRRQENALITGQDGSYLAEFLLTRNYIVHGIKPRTKLNNT